MKLKILGTSNAIIRDGYGQMLGQMEGVSVVENLSVGSSHSCIIPVAIERDNANLNADVFVLDMCVNEQRAVSKGLFNTSTSEAMLDYFVGYCLSNNAIPLVVLLPNLSNGTFNEETVRRWAALCHERHIPIVDILALVQSTQPPAELWRDNSHPTPEFSYAIAHEIVQTSQRLKSNPPTITQTAVDLSIFRSNRGRCVERSTALVSRTFSRFALGDTFEISLQDGEDFEVLGTSLNMAQTYAALKFQGDGTIVQRYDNGFFNPKKDLWYVCWSLVESIKSQDGRVTVEVVRPVDNERHLKNDHITGHISKDIDPIMELESFILIRN